MYTLLGFILAILLMLIVVPMIWRRAVRLTEKRVLGEVPITYSELQAEKDMQRAEQAITQRRLEVLTDSQREQLTMSSIKIDRLKETISKRDTSIEANLATIDTLEKDIATRKEQYKEQSGKLDQSRQSLKQANEKISGLEELKSDLGNEILHLETSKSEQKVELVAQLARIEGLKDEVSELTQALKKETDAKADALSKLTQKSSDFDRNKERLEKQDEKLASLQGELADKDSEVSTLKQRLKRLKANSGPDDGETTARLAEVEARRVEAEAKISSLTLQLSNQNEALEEGGTLDTVMDKLKEDNLQLTKDLAKLQKSHDALDAELTSLRDAKDIDEDSPLSPSEHKLRDEIKTIAALVTKTTMDQEGASSPVAKIMDEEEKAKEKAQAAQDSSKSETPDALAKVMSLADRILSLKHSDTDAKADDQDDNIDEDESPRIQKQSS
ncbi:MAG: hypothetical protein N4A65_01825 [Cohaesibacter sp.]|jgi:chromosome segregation ATPase|nr:hypothetical protein [Cohaesibacter sp.]